MVKMMNEAAKQATKRTSEAKVEDVSMISTDRVAKPTLRLQEQKSMVSGTTRASEGKNLFISRYSTTNDKSFVGKKQLN